MGDQRLIRLWRIFVRLAYLTAAAVMFMNNGCTMAQRRTAVHGVETVGIAYTALLTTMVAHESGHLQEEMLDGLSPIRFRVEPQLYRFWEIPRKGSIGLTWDLDIHDGKSSVYNRFMGKTYLYLPPAAVLRERQWVTRLDIHGSLAGIMMSNRWYMALDQGLRNGKIDNRFAHALALFMGLDPVVQACDGYRNYTSGNSELRVNDLGAYLDEMGGAAHLKDTLRTAIELDLFGKGPELWWHLRGIAGYRDPAPTWWHIGRMEIRTGMVITEWRFGYGVNATLSF